MRDLSRPRAWAAVIGMCAVFWLRAGPPPRAAGQTAGLPAPETLIGPKDREVQVRDGLVAGLLGTLARSAVPSDLLAWKLAAGTFTDPREGDVLGPDDRNRSQTWARAQAGADGWIQNRALNGGYFFATLVADRPRTMVLDASSYYVARLNGEPRGGEKYGTDWVRHPVRLKQGRNTLLVQGERGRLRIRLFDPPAPLYLTDVDATLPDLVTGETGTWWTGVRLVNATSDTISGIELSYALGDQTRVASMSATVPPLMTRKLAVPLLLRAPDREGAAPVSLRLRARAGIRPIETPSIELPLKAVSPSAHHVRTFVSEIDGSVQYYGVVPQARPSGSAEPSAAAPARPALIVSLHGAGVEGIGQARAYTSKDWAVIVAPTNRRPYGFDWEDWGRLDALEAQADAARRFGTDPQRTYLTGHSMGGHGTWHIGATLPGLWAAIAPSAGWRSFSTYGGGPTYANPTAIESMLARANHPGETAELAANLLHYGVYVLHGDKDDNVPVAQARFMRELLAKFHPDFAYYERPGAGHWWGNECVDWPPLVEFLRGHVRPADAEAARVEFVTASPAISSSSRFVTVLAQEKPLEYSRVAIDRDPRTGAFKGTTTNVAALRLTPLPAASGATTAAIVVDLDGTRIEVPRAPDGRVLVEKVAGGWRAGAPPDAAFKGPARGGGFKDAFRHRVVLVYGTRGTPEEKARAFNKARFDAEMFWHRGNGTLDMAADTAFDPAKTRDRNVVLYGNADTNTAWATLLAGAPIDVRNGRARLGTREFAGTDLAAYVIRPRADSPTASVGIVAWTGPAGWVAASPGQYFVSGAGFPDALIFSADTLRAGTSGVRAIGWFGRDWGVETGDFVWGTAAPAGR